MMHWRMTLTGCLMVLALAACSSGGGGGDDEGDATTTQVGGTAQKGPFRMGETVTATRLSGDGTLSGDTESGETGERGDYDLGAVPWAGPTRLQVEGDFFNEVEGNYTGTSRTLNAVTRLSEGEAPTVNVNLYTHFIEARTRALMGDGSGFDDALDQARSELQAAFDLDANPADLNLLQVLDASVEEGSTNLLMFSAALLQAGIEQTGLDAMAADFADNGRIDGDGIDELAAVEDEQSSSLLDDARTALTNQFSTEPPDSGGGGFGWILDECALKTLNITNRAVICTRQDDASFSRSGQMNETTVTSVFVAESPGHLWLEVVVPPEDDLPSFNEWSLHSYSEDDTPTFCDNYSYDSGESSSGGRSAEGVTDRLDPNESYCLSSYINPAFGDGGPSELDVNWFKVSEGGPRLAELVPLTLGDTYRGVVGNTVSTAQDMPAYSYYGFEVRRSGDYRILVDGYSNLGSGSMRIGLFADEDDSGGITFYNDQERVDFTGGPGTDSTSTEMVKSLSAGLYGVRIFNGTNHRGNSDGSPVEFDIEVTRQ